MKRPLKKMKKLPFLAADFEKRKKEKRLNSPNLSNIFVKGTLILNDCGIASYPCSSYGASNCYFVSIILAKF